MDVVRTEMEAVGREGKTPEKGDGNEWFTLATPKGNS